MSQYAELKQQDKLNREPLIHKLTTLLKNIPSPYTLSVNARWGMGKTTMLKLWEAYLLEENFQCFYFSAWENDFHTDPLVALMAQLQQFTVQFQTNGQQQPQEIYQSMLKKGELLLRRSTPLILKALVRIITRGALSNDDFSEMRNVLAINGKDIDNVADSFGDIAKNEIEHFLEQQKTIVTFRETLKEFAELVTGYSNDRKPLVIFIDELDRCRPSYAIELLETVKHFFTVEGVVFVFGIDMEQLGKSASVLYGANMDTQGYFRRLIDHEFILPLPDTKSLSTHLYENTINPSIKQELLIKYKDSLHEVIEIMEELSSAFNLSIRDLETLCKRYQLVISLSSNSYSIPFINFTLFLILVKCKFPQTYSDVKNSLFRNPPGKGILSGNNSEDIYQILRNNPEVLNYLQKSSFYGKRIAVCLIMLAVSQAIVSGQSSLQAQYYSEFGNTLPSIAKNMSHKLTEEIIIDIIDSIELTESFRI